VVVGIQYWSFQRVKGGEELTGGIVLMGEMKKVGRRFGSATHAWRSAADGATVPTGGDGGSGETEEEESPGGLVLGRKVVVTWASVGISKENRDGLPWPSGQIDGQNRRVRINYFQI
jgi:hypothetical protein